MEVIIGKNAGFCYGVERAVDTTKKELENCGGLYCLGELVHNSRVVKDLEDKGLITVEDIGECTGVSAVTSDENIMGTNMSKNSAKTIIRAHGVSKQVYEEAEKLGVEVIDLTCPNVLKIHNVIEEYANNGYFIFLIGSKKHPETIGSYGFAGMYSYIIENEEDIIYGLESLKKSKKTKLLVVVQTTFSLNKFNEFVDIINRSISENINSELSYNVEVEIKNTICNATKLRQEETRELAKNVDCMIIIGGKNSSNTKKLYEMAVMNCESTFWIEDVDELIEYKNSIKECKKVGIMAGASTPKEHIEEIRNMLEKEEIKI